MNRRPLWLRGIPIAICLCLAGGFAVAQEAPPGAPGPGEKGLSFRDRWDLAFRQGDLILLARVLRVDGTTVVLEPQEFLKGGLDGDEIEVRAPSDSGAGREVAEILRASAEVDSLGLIAFLSREVNGWIIKGIRDDAFPTGVIPLAQRDWAAVLGRVKHARDELALDRVLGRATCVLVVEPSPENGATAYRVTKRLKGVARDVIRIDGAPSPASAWPRVLALRRYDPVNHAPIPYTWFPDLPEVPPGLAVDSVVTLVEARLRVIDAAAKASGSEN